MSGGGKFATHIHANLVLSGVHVVFEVFQDTWHSNKENPSVYWHATLSCPSMASNSANVYLFAISLWMLTIPWTS